MKSKLNFLKATTLAVLIVFVGAVPRACANTPGKKTATITWSASVTPGVTYNLYRATTTGVCAGTPTPLASAIIGTTYTDTTVVPGPVFYAVSAVNATGESACSAEGSANIPTITAQPPVGSPIIVIP